jgi:hypothetical protein
MSLRDFSGTGELRALVWRDRLLVPRDMGDDWRELPANDRAIGSLGAVETVLSASESSLTDVDH